ncbi:MAG: hypothetical protein LQ338_008065 [Usnochroma carphineum]|nr:MAG: hypothetical protein LQ338_008065 [Usnochroma carphineum]
MLPQLILFLSFLVSTLRCQPTTQALELEFAHDPHLATGPEPGDSTIVRQEVEVNSARKSSLDAVEHFDSINQGISPRDLELSFAEDPPLDGADQSDSAPERRGISPAVAKDVLELERSNEKCAVQFDDKKYLARSVTLAKRVDIPAQTPADILWTAPAQCLIVGMEQSNYLPFSGQTQNVIGTRGLCGCIALAIVGEAGAVVAHLAPKMDMTSQFNSVLADFTRMQGQNDITAYLFRPDQGPVITAAMAAAGSQLAAQVRDFIIDNMGIPVVARGYDAGSQTLANTRVGTLVTAAVGGVVRLWINNRLANN